MTSVGTLVRAYSDDNELSAEITNIYSKGLEFIAIKSLICDDNVSEFGVISVKTDPNHLREGDELEVFYSGRFKHHIQIFENPDNDRRIVWDIFHNKDNMSDIINYIDDSKYDSMIGTINRLRLKLDDIERNLFINWVKRLFR